MALQKQDLCHVLPNTFQSNAFQTPVLTQVKGLGAQVLHHLLQKQH